MSNTLINHNPDLKKLRDEGFNISIEHNHLIISGVPYVNGNKEPVFGKLITPLGDMAGDQTVKPQDHTIYFAGDVPCYPDGTPIKGMLNSSQKKILAEGIEVDHYFSAKPDKGYYDDYYEKVTTYVEIIVTQAQAIDGSLTAKNFDIPDNEDPNDVFCYPDTNSSRAEIEAVSSKLNNIKLAIVGLGGTGSYILDFVAKTPVQEIHLFDGDTLYSHNAFRSPGATSIDILREKHKKVDYLQSIYSNMHKHIIPHVFYMDENTLDELNGIDFVFICIDDGDSKNKIIDKLISESIPFVDVGIGVEEIDGLLSASARITTASKTKNDHIQKTISFSENNNNNDYDKNIQIAELNALNASLAVIKWKKMFGYYHDLEKEHQTIYDLDVNKLVNDEIDS